VHPLFCQIEGLRQQNKLPSKTSEYRKIFEWSGLCPGPGCGSLQRSSMLVGLPLPQEPHSAVGPSRISSPPGIRQQNSIDPFALFFGNSLTTVNVCARWCVRPPYSRTKIYAARVSYTADDAHRPPLRAFPAAARAARGTDRQTDTEPF